MDDSYSNGLERITNDFNDRYGNISGIDKMYYYTSFDKQIMHCLRQALYYELYGNSDKFSKAPKLPYDETAIVFVDNLKNAYDGVEDTVYIPLKMAAFVQKLSKNTSYDFSKYWNDALSDSLKSLLSELNVAHSYQTVYTINALFSDFSIKPDFSSKSAYQRNWMQHMRPIQQDINYYMTQSDHIQLAYGMGLIVPNGVDNQRYNYQSLRLHPAWPCSLLSMDLNLIYQDANGWSPMILYGKSVPNHLAINQKTEKWFRYMYYVNHEEVFNHDSITEDDIRNEFTFLDSKLAQNLELEPVTHLNLNVPNAVQAFALKQNENNIQQVYTLQYDNSTMSEVFHIGHINQNDSNKIHTCNFDETFTIGSDLAAHSQTLAPADDSYQSFFIGFFHNAFIKSKFKWATCLGLFDLANPDNQKTHLFTMNSRIPYLYGFNAYRLEATTDLDHNLLIIQEIDKNHGMKFIKYKLTDIINKLYNTYFDHNRAISPFETFGVDIHQFKLLDTFSIPGNMNIVESFQGFAYDGVYNRIILSSQFGPDKLKLDQDKTLFIPKYDTQRMIYVIPWNIPEYRYWTRIPLTNFQGITIKSLINDQLNDNLKPITFATELESNIIVNSTFVYQLIVYHYSDHDMVAQDNLNDIIKISWNEFS